MAYDDTEQQISLPTLLVILVLAGAIIRFLFFSSVTATPGAGAGGRHNPLNVLRTREAAMERIQQMFPQVDRRTILWDLQRNGGNIQATSERILSGRIETPPVTFQPPPPPGGFTTRPTGAPKQPEKPSQPDLITRYNLHDKLETPTTGSGERPSDENSATASGKAWSADREERQASLRKRRDDMILQARKRMEAKMAEEQAKSAA